MQEIRIMTDGKLLVFDMAEKRLDFFQSDGIGLAPALRLLEISHKRLRLDPQDVQPSLEFMSRRLANFLNFLSQRLKLGLGFQDFPFE